MGSIKKFRVKHRQLETAKGGMAGLWSIDNYQKQNVKGFLLKKKCALHIVKIKATDKGPDGKNSSRYIYIWCVKE